MQKKVVAFLVMSGILMISYLLVIADPSLPGDFELYDDDTDNGEISDTEVGGTLYCNTYVAYQNKYVNSNTRNYASYHWAKVTKQGAGNSHFYYEFQPGCFGLFQESGLINTSDNPWERDRTYSKNVAKGTIVSPYTEIHAWDQSEDNRVVKAKFQNIKLQ